MSSSWIELLHHGGTDDQLNLAGLASFEAAARRIQSIVDAYSGGSERQDWDSVRFYSEVRKAEDLVSPELRSFGAKKGKEEAELLTGKNRARDIRPALEQAAAGAIQDGALGGGGGGEVAGAVLEDDDAAKRP